MCQTVCVARTYAGKDQAARVSERRERLLDAALHVVGDPDSAATVRGVCRAAGLTERYFYESFADLDALQIALFDTLSAEAAAAVLAVGDRAGDDARARSAAAIGAFVDFVTADERRARVLFTAARDNPALMRRRRDGLRVFTALLADQARAFYGDRPGSAAVVDLTASVLVGGTAELLMTWMDGEVALTRDELVEILTELFVATGETAVVVARRSTT